MPSFKFLMNNLDFGTRITDEYPDSEFVWLARRSLFGYVPEPPHPGDPIDDMLREDLLKKDFCIKANSREYYVNQRVFAETTGGSLTRFEISDPGNHMPFFVDLMNGKEVDLVDLEFTLDTLDF